jgi:hypothetical protein
VTSPPLTEVWKDCFRHNDDTEQIRINLRADVRQRSVFDGTHIAIAGIVNEDVEATEGLDRFIDGALCLSFVRDVERNGPHALSKLASEIHEMLRIAGRGQYAVPGFEGLFSEGSPEATGSPRY